MPEHEKYRQMLELFISGELPPEEREALALHLEECGECSERLALSNLLPDILPPEEDPPEELVGLIMAKTVGPARSRRRHVLTNWLAAAAVLAVVIIPAALALRGAGASESDAVSNDEIVAGTMSPGSFEPKESDLDESSPYGVMPPSAPEDAFDNALPSQPTSPNNGGMYIQGGKDYFYNGIYVDVYDTIPSGYSATVLCDELPETLENEDPEFALSDGRVCFVVEAETLGALEDQGFEVTYNSSPTNSDVLVVVRITK